MAENFKRKSCIFLSIRAQEASGLNLQKGIFCNRFQCFSQRCCLNQEIYLAARPPQLVFLISKIKVFGLHLTPSKCCDNPVLSQKIFRFKNRFTETKLFFPPLGVPPNQYISVFLGSILPQYMALSVSSVSLVRLSKKIQVTSKQGMRLRFGMLIVLTNIRSTKVLHHTSCIMHHASQATSKQGRGLRFSMLTVLRNIR